MPPATSAAEVAGDISAMLWIGVSSTPPSSDRCARSYSAAELIAEEMSLRDLRKTRKLTQTRVAKALGVTQDSASRLETRGDHLLSTLRKTVKAMGGDVRIVAEFPGRAPVVLADLSGGVAPCKLGRRARA
ncbi:MAG: helix-turn-helix transcriptional regulator [Candidatus Acidiferrales bacterium]